MISEIPITHFALLASRHTLSFDFISLISCFAIAANDLKNMIDGQVLAGLRAILSVDDVPPSKQFSMAFNTAGTATADSFKRILPANLQAISVPRASVSCSSCSWCLFSRIEDRRQIIATQRECLPWKYKQWCCRITNSQCLTDFLCMYILDSKLERMAAYSVGACF